jgi:prolyl-tRNA synthetase
MLLRQTQLVSRTVREASKEDVSVNAQLLVRAGFVDKLFAGVYSYLPLGCRVLAKIERIVREEMTRIGSQEVLMPALQPREIWDTTNRWDMEVLFRLKGDGERDLALGPTHEEVVTPLVGRFLHSYKDLPASVFQIQTKFRNEPRAKSGVLRGREFRMKDMYSFHLDQADMDAFYERAKVAYTRVFDRCGLGPQTFLTFASGGAFSKYSHEYQTITPFGEDTIHLWREKGIAVNREILEDIRGAPEWNGAQFEEVKAIEVGNIFQLGTRFSDACGISVQDGTGTKRSVLMGCYGIGSTRLLGTVVEVHHDERGILWPEEVAPFDLHLLSLVRSAEEKAVVEQLLQKLDALGVDVLLDDREVSAGQKFADSDLIGIPTRAIVSAKTLAAGCLEVKRRASAEAEQIPTQAFLTKFA